MFQMPKRIYRTVICFSTIFSMTEFIIREVDELAVFCESPEIPLDTGYWRQQQDKASLNVVCYSGYPWPKASLLKGKGVYSRPLLKIWSLKQIVWAIHFGGSCLGGGLLTASSSNCNIELVLGSKHLEVSEHVSLYLSLLDNIIFYASSMQLLLNFVYVL